jgi:predicted alpha/beta hydrolase family esterase
VYVVPNLGYNLYSVPDSSAIVNEVIKKENLTNVILVAHSKGGLIGKHALIHRNSDNAILGMVSIATPYSGSAMAKLVPYDPIRELLKDNATIKDLQSHEQVNTKIVSICPLYDNHVWAEEGSHLKGAKNIDVDVHGHHKIVYDDEVIKKVLESTEEMTQAKFHNTEMQR